MNERIRELNDFILNIFPHELHYINQVILPAEYSDDITRVLGTVDFGQYDHQHILLLFVGITTIPRLRQATSSLPKELIRVLKTYLIG
jgi:hypothetical protein